MFCVLAIWLFRLELLFSKCVTVHNLCNILHVYLKPFILEGLGFPIVSVILGLFFVTITDYAFKKQKERFNRMGCQQILIEL